MENHKCLTLPKGIQSFSDFKCSYPLAETTDFAGVTKDDRIYVRGGKMTLSDYELDTVIWAEHCITVRSLRAGKDVVSFDFSGCSMAVFLDKGIYYAAHIHSSTDPGSDRKCAWIRMMNAYPGTTPLWMFRPDFKCKTYEHHALWGLITKERNCYSVYVKCLNKEGTKFAVLHITQHDTDGLKENYKPILSPDLLSGADDAVNYRGVHAAWDDFWEHKRCISLWNAPAKSMVRSSPSAEEPGEVGTAGCCCVC